MIDYFEDLEIGDEQELGSYTFTREDIIRFAEKYDPQPYHLSDEGAAQTHFGKLCASGWHTASIFMRLLVLKTQELAAQAAAQGHPVAKTGPSPGLEDLKWLRPVYVGDTVTYTRRITEKTETASRPEWGIVHGDNRGVNQHGETVFCFKSKVFQERRPQKG
ncbi:MaoC family dehydratase [Roseibium sp.]|uniref:MaoC family dehydratase n=1 Tax=Roseibium sp. TaxID=1936156 RepID=UPI003A96B138